MHECGWVNRARIRPGRDVMLLDLSTGGARLEAAVRLLPGSRVELQLLTAEVPRVVACRVLRCWVSALSGEDRIRYTAAVGFDTRLAIPGEDPKNDGYLLPHAFAQRGGFKGRRYPAGEVERVS